MLAYVRGDKVRMSLVIAGRVQDRGLAHTREVGALYAPSGYTAFWMTFRARDMN